MERIISILGIGVMLGIAWLLSENKKRFDWKLVGSGVALQFVFGLLILHTSPGRWVFSGANKVITQVIQFANEGSKLVFGDAYQEHFIAFSVLPTIIFFSSIVAIFFYLGIIQKVLGFFSYVMKRVMNISGAESLAAAANVFVGGVEAALLIKPYIKSLTRSEMMALMTGGMATVAGGVMAAYVGLGIDAGHLLAASIMSAPASLVLAKIMVPEVATPTTMGEVKVEFVPEDENILDAACRGAFEGLKLVATIAAMLIAFVALAAMLNAILGLLPDVAGAPLTFERILGWVFMPIVFFTGAPWEDAAVLGTLLGKKMFLNEFVAYLDLKAVRDQIQPRSFVLATYFLCGFANFSSIAMTIGGLSSLCPERRKDFAQLGLKCMLGGTLAALMTACIAGILI